MAVETETAEAALWPFFRAGLGCGSTTGAAVRGFREVGELNEEEALVCAIGAD